MTAGAGRRDVQASPGGGYDWRTWSMASLVIVLTFVTAPRVVIGGFRILPEQLGLVAAAVVLVIVAPARCIAMARHRAVRYAAAYIAWLGLVSVVRSADVAESFRIVAWLIFDLGILVVVAAVLPWDRILKILSIGAAGSAVIGIVCYATYNELGLGARPGEGGGIAVFGVSHEPNQLAATLAVTALALIAGWSRIGPWRLGVLFIIFIAMILTQTRSAILGLLVGLLLLGLRPADQVQRRRFRKIGVFVICCLVVAYFVLPGASAFVIAKFANLRGGTGQYRLASYQYALDEMNDALDVIVGQGANAFSIGLDQREQMLPGEVPIFLSNLPMQVLYDSGIIGLLLLVLFFRALRPPAGAPNTCRAVYLAAGSGFLVIALFTSPFWFGFSWVLGALLVSASLPTSQVENEAAGESPSGAAPRSRLSGVASLRNHFRRPDA